MEISISPENQKFVDLTIEQGTFANENEAVNAALAALRDRDELRRHLAEAINSESIPAEIVFAQLERRAEEIASSAK